MGDRYILTIECLCGHEDPEVYYAPTCGFSMHKCSACGHEIDLADYTGISYEDASNLGLITEAIAKVKKEKEP